MENGILAVSYPFEPVFRESVANPLVNPARLTTALAVVSASPTVPVVIAGFITVDGSVC